MTESANRYGRQAEGQDEMDLMFHETGLGHGFRLGALPVSRTQKVIDFIDRYWLPLSILTIAVTAVLKWRFR